MKQRVVVAVAALAFAACPVCAQTAAGTPATQSKSGSAMKSAADADQAFARDAAIGGMAEVQLGNLAKQNASSADVKQFGDRMSTDHGKGNDELKQLAATKNLTLPADLDAKHKAVVDRLSKLNGAAFDKAYMTAMVSDHKEDVAKFRKESTSGKDADLKAWAAKTLPTLEEHLKMAQDTASKVGGTMKTGK
ncbi:MAG TPA: DUF4142 domain-containing protein [Vicinamibacterales bacterium]|jgi:putative membrane protein